VLAIAAIAILTACVADGPLTPPEASRAEATRLGAKIYEGEIPTGNGAAVVRVAHDAWLQVMSGDGQKVSKGLTVILDASHFSISGASQGSYIQGQPIYEVHGFVEPVVGKPNMTLLSIYHTQVQNPDSSMSRRVSLENAAHSLPTRESAQRIWAQMLPRLQQYFARRS